MTERSRKYTAEFKYEAMRLLIQDIRSDHEIEHDLGIGKGVVFR